MENIEDLSAVAHVLGIIPISNNYAEKKQELIEAVNNLILTNFDRLVGMLYRLDINENKINTFLRENAGIDAAKIIVELMIEREVEKAKARKIFTRPTDDKIDEAEKW